MPTIKNFSTKDAKKVDELKGHLFTEVSEAPTPKPIEKEKKSILKKLGGKK